VFEGEGKITDFPGNYTIYRNKVEEDEEKSKNKARAEARTAEIKPKEKPQNENKKQKLSFNEKREFEQLEKEIPELEFQKEKLENQMNSGELAHDELYEKSLELEKIKTLLDEKEFRWLELSEIGN